MQYKTKSKRQVAVELPDELVAELYCNGINAANVWLDNKSRFEALAKLWKTCKTAAGRPTFKDKTVRLALDASMAFAFSEMQQLAGRKRPKRAMNMRRLEDLTIDEAVKLCNYLRGS